MAERTMSDEHKAAIAAGRIEAAAVRDYLEALETHRPRPGRKQTAESLTAKRAAVDAQIADAKPIKRLLLMQERRDIEAAIEALQVEPDMASVETGFIEHASSYGQRKRVQYATWREFGVTPEMLARAGITRGQ
ncbi:hypothetical protein [Candidatus Poriferisodalis sp.]|uniref:hypothetical protein n=1 Tax=Candidatus Poriferisodalis sp. TaxID=3101277 RepID=UPI003D122C13